MMTGGGWRHQLEQPKGEFYQQLEAMFAGERVMQRKLRNAFPGQGRGAHADLWITQAVDKKQAAYTVERIRSAVNAATLDVYIDSEGGDVLAGTSICAALKAFKGRTTALIRKASSMGGFIALACGDRLIEPQGSWLYHSVINGTRAQRDDAQDFLTAMVARLGITGELEQLLRTQGDQNMHLSSVEAVALGLAHEICDFGWKPMPRDQAAYAGRQLPPAPPPRPKREPRRAREQARSFQGWDLSSAAARLEAAMIFNITPERSDRLAAAREKVRARV